MRLEPVLGPVFGLYEVTWSSVEVSNHYQYYIRFQLPTSNIVHLYQISNIIPSSLEVFMLSCIPPLQPKPTSGDLE